LRRSTSKSIANCGLTLLEITQAFALADPAASCDSQPVSDGRGNRIALASLAALACGLIPVASGMASGAPPDGLSAEGHTKFIFLKARVVSDGSVTPGQPETISVSRLAPKANVRVFIEAPPTTLQCGELYFCDPAPTTPAAGSPPYHSDKKGRATLTFVMPDTYYLEVDPFNPQARQPVKFADQQRVHIDVESASKTRRVKRESFGFARAIVHL
jgi:hypothetical protein